MTTSRSILTPFQLTTTSGLLQNQGLAANSVFESSVSSYLSTALIEPLANAVSVGSTGNILSANTIIDLVTFASNSCPALGDSIPVQGVVSGPTQVYVNDSITVTISNGLPYTNFIWASSSSPPNAPENDTGGFTFDSTGSYSYTINRSVVGTYSWIYEFVATGQAGTYTIEVLPLSSPTPSGSYTSTTTTWPTELMSTLLTNTANTYMGNGDLTKFIQAFSIALGYADSTNQFINTTVNSDHYLCNTFTNIDNMLTGDITAVNICTAQWAIDLNNLGSLISLRNLGELGSPIALVKQLASLGGLLPQITTAFADAGVSTDTIINLSDPNVTASISDQKAMYLAMTQITGNTLLEVLQIFGIKNNYYTGSVVGPVSAYVNKNVSVYITGGVPNTTFSWKASPGDPPTYPSGEFTFDITGSFTYTFSEGNPGTYNWSYSFDATGQTGNYTLLVLPEGATPAPDAPPDRPDRAPGTLPVNITTMADLLNPYKLFPNSFQTLSVVDVNLVTQNIYIDSSGTVNSILAQTLPNISLYTIS